jgi:predicted ATP-dependent serine protease
LFDSGMIALRKLPSMTKKIFKKLCVNRITSPCDVSITGIEGLASQLIQEANLWAVEHQREMLQVLPGNYDTISVPPVERISLTTGCKNLDRILNGGFMSPKIYEFYGPPNIGKTYLMHHFLCRAVLPKSQGGLESPVIYLDSGGKFNPKLLRTIASRFNLDTKEVYHNVARLVLRDSRHFLEAVEKTVPKFLQKYDALVIIVDSIIENARTDYDARTQLTPRQGMLQVIVGGLKNIARVRNAIVIITNDLIDGGYAGGTFIGSAVSVRIAMKFVEGRIDLREFFVEKATNIPEISCILSISTDGFHDTNLKE